MKTFAFALLASGALAALSDTTLVKRELVRVPCSEQGLIDCGTGCILPGYTCCPDRRGGCSAVEYCDLADNGVYGCCPRGETCRGTAGVDIHESTRTVLIPGQTSTSTIDLTSVSQQTQTASVPAPPPTTSTTSTSTPPAAVSTPSSSSSSSSSSSQTPVVIPSSNGTLTTSPTVAPTAAAAMNAVNLLGAVAAGAFAWLL